MAFVLVELCAIRAFGQAVEVTEQIEQVLLRRGGFAPFFGLAAQIVDQHLGLDLLLDVQRRRIDDQI
ncbi:Uncharacterised protein [Bordetella pertussis]|nr:Uncharacterised protein [Bordetella pertussis]CFO63700.1 Uncharacterised protein [Bordetella pertussis]CFU78664.1 Uncharacterised protein [Bordetella pertussis]CPH57656.1 Uncharacterised protein [Bordetella pertussis]CPL45385.1 Uncharacterised protein [Bordetella pertussis]